MSAFKVKKPKPLPQPTVAQLVASMIELRRAYEHLHSRLSVLEQIERQREAAETLHSPDLVVVHG